jgi:hypothetical protein
MRDSRLAPLVFCLTAALPQSLDASGIVVHFRVVRRGTVGAIGAGKLPVLPSPNKGEVAERYACFGMHFVGLVTIPPSRYFGVGESNKQVEPWTNDKANAID